MTYLAVLARLLPVVVASFALEGCVDEPAVQHEEPGLGEEDLDPAKADGAATRWTYYSVTRVETNGLWVKRLNQPDTKCADTRWASECFVTAIDWSRAGFSQGEAMEADITARAQRSILRGKLVNGEVDGQRVAQFRASEAWETTRDGAVEGSAWWVSGACGATCSDLTGTRLNKSGASSSAIYVSASLANLTNPVREVIASERGALVIGAAGDSDAGKTLDGLRTYLRREHTEADDARTDATNCSAASLATFPKDELRVHIIDVGQGDAIWVQTPWSADPEESLNVLVDAGPSGKMPASSPGGDVIVGYLRAHGLVDGDVLDALVVTHAHDDHYGGVERVTESFGLARYVDPGFTAGSAAFIAARGAATEDVTAHGGELHIPASTSLVPALFMRSDLFGPRVATTLLWSSEGPHDDGSEPTGREVNNTSIALALVFGGRRVLLMGDIESAVESVLVAAHDAGEINLDASILKVAHHGSQHTTSSEFLARVFPSKRNDRYALISSGRRAFQGAYLPTDATLTRLIEALPERHVLSTENRDQHKSVGDEHGDDTIVVRIKASGQVSACYAP